MDRFMALVDLRCGVGLVKKGEMIPDDEIAKWKPNAIEVNVKYRKIHDTKGEVCIPRHDVRNRRWVERILHEIKTQKDLPSKGQVKGNKAKPKNAEKKSAKKIDGSSENQSTAEDKTAKEAEAAARVVL